MKPLIMSSSGIRGVIGENLDPRIATRVGMAFGMMTGKGPVIVGGDTRTSHDMLKQALVSGLTAVGTEVIDIGKVPTPTVQQMIRHFHAKGGIVITASHNPVMWNGLKVMNANASFLDEEEYAMFVHHYQTDVFSLADWKNIGSLTHEKNALSLHVSHILSLIDCRSIQQSKLRVLIDPNNGAGSLADPILLEALGVTYHLLNEKPDGHFSHDPEPLKRNVSDMITELKTGQYDIGFVQDADADRLVILDETGQFIGEDYSLGLCVDYILSQDSSPDKKVVVNLSTSQLIEWIASRHNASTFYTKIGETHVTQGIKHHQAVVGGEGNGGVIFPKIGWGRDSLVGIVIALKYLCESKKTVSEIVKTYPQYVMLRKKVEVATQEEVRHLLHTIEASFPDIPKNKEDGIKLFFEEGWVHIRPSNTEPIVRLFSEAPTLEKAQKLLDYLNTANLPFANAL